MQYLIEVEQYTNEGKKIHEVNVWLDDLIPYPEQINTIDHRVTTCIYWKKSERDSVWPSRDRLMELLENWEIYRGAHFIPEHVIEPDIRDRRKKNYKNFNANQTVLELI